MHDGHQGSERGGACAMHERSLGAETLGMRVAAAPLVSAPLAIKVARPAREEGLAAKGTRTSWGLTRWPHVTPLLIHALRPTSLFGP